MFAECFTWLLTNVKLKFCLLYNGFFFLAFLKGQIHGLLSNICTDNRFPHMSSESLQLFHTYHGPLGWFSDYLLLTWAFRLGGWSCLGKFVVVPLHVLLPDLFAVFLGLHDAVHSLMFSNKPLRPSLYSYAVLCVITKM
ncbi:hypothetical protein ATANTOWER_008648 [Ataeniobius toweri]|uniref:Uncharacterized protein n=1 Tax=Ataeniobius toweri TaxID=208326 RepID=A0ABU7C7C9_9TELE|nr:hypothetical protein [Ataeniobius toweri]